MSNDQNTTAAEEPRVIELQRYVRGMLEPRVALLFSEMADHLFNLSSSSQLASERRTQCFEAFSSLKLQSKNLVSGMLAHIEQDYLTLVEDRHDSVQRERAELNLIDINEFENSLAIDRIVRAGSERYWVALEAITLRLASIVNADPTAIRLPFGIRALCTAYREVIKPLELSSDIVDELDKAFARYLLPELKGIYKDINQKLESDGLLPGIEIDIENSGSTLSPQSTESGDRPTTLSHQQASIAAASAGKSRGESGGESREQGLRSQATQQHSGNIPTPAYQAHARPQLHDQAQHSADLEPPYLSDMDQGTASHSPGTSHHQIPSNPSDLSSALLHNSVLKDNASMAIPSPLDTAAATQEFIDYLPGHGSQALAITVNNDVLNRLQRGGDYGAVPDHGLSPAELAQKTAALYEQLASLRSESLRSTPPSSPLIQQLGLDDASDDKEPLRGNIALVDELFEALTTTLSENTSLSKSLNILKLPLAQLALKEPDFYRNREHPARLLIERLSEISGLAPRGNGRVERDLDEVLGQVNEHYDGDINVFDNALAQVTNLALTVLRQQQRNIKRQVEAEEGKEKRLSAQHKVDQDLLDAMPQTKLPERLTRVVDELLCDELTLRALRDETDPKYRDTLDTIKVLNDALQGQNALSTAEIIAAVTALRGNLEGLQLLSPHQEPLLQELEQQLLSDDDIAFVNSNYGAQAVFSEPKFSKRLQKLPRLSRWIHRARELTPKVWLAETDAFGATRHLQLIWMNSDATRFVLANEQGQKVYDFNLLTLARALARNLRPLSPSEQLSVVERSVFSTLEKRQEELASSTRKNVGEELSRSELIDHTQSMLRRARRKGPTHAAIAVHSDDAASRLNILATIDKGGFAIDALGALSENTEGLIIHTDSLDKLQAVINGQLDNNHSAGISMSIVDATHDYADSFWISLEDTAQRGLSLSPNMGLVAPIASRPADLAEAVRKTYQRLKEDMPPKFSLRRLRRSRAKDPGFSEFIYQVLIDGSPDAGAEISRQTGYHSAALSIALDCIKINTACSYAEQVINAGRELPVFNLLISTDAALHHEFLDFVLNQVSESGIGTDRLCIELNDSTRLREAERAADFARTLRSIGCQIGINEVHPARGSTSKLQALNPHMLILDASLWPPAENNKLSNLNLAISDLHHMVGEHVVLRDSRERAQAIELGIDLIESVENDDIDGDDLLKMLPQIQR